MSTKVLLAAGLALGTVIPVLPQWSFAGSPPAPTNDHPAEKIELVPPLPPSSRKPERVVQFELTEEYEQGLLPPGRRVGLIVRLLGESGKAPGANIVAILESGGSGRTLISLAPGKDQAILEAMTSVELPAMAETVGSDGSGRGDGPRSVQVVRINVTFARLQGMRLEPLFKRRIYFALGRNTYAASASLPGATAPGEIQINAATASTSPEGDPPSVPGIIDHVVIETDLVHGLPVSDEARGYWRDLGRRIRDRWTERNPAIVQEKTARTPRVRFRLYPSGIAQMIYLERNSGNVRVDIAGLESVLITQPFSPFPAQLSEPYVNVHVHFRDDQVNR